MKASPIIKIAVIGLVSGLCLAFLVLVVDVVWFLNHPMNQDLETNTQSLEYTVPQGASIRKVSEELVERISLQRPLYLQLYARLNGSATKIQAGEYSLDPQMTPLQLLKVLTSGKVKQYSITLIEGWTFKQLMIAVSASEHLDHQLTSDKPIDVMTALGYSDLHPEGQFLPDTYFFPKGTTDIDFLQRAQKVMQQQLDQAWEGRELSLPLATRYDALILASIVERETAVPSERPEIAGVFVERLRKGMRLQTDPTVIYGMGENYHGNIRYRDLRKDTPYNTYTRAGLPPTPIAMPSLAAIEAVLHPNTTGALYFVARGDGSHKFSETLEQHNKAVVKYQLKGNTESKP